MSFPIVAIADAPLKIVSLQGELLRLSDDRRVKLTATAPLGKLKLPDGWINTAITADCHPIKDRYGQESCIIKRYKDGATLQQELFSSGAAMIYSAAALPDEIIALTESENISPQSATTVSAKPNRWAIIEGVARDIASLKSATYINFGEDWKTDFTIHIPKATLKSFSPEALNALKDQKIQIRGWLHSYYGPRITLFNPQMMKVVP